MTVNKKVCILGEFGVGKTSLVRRYVLNEFSPAYQATLGVNIYKYADEVDVPSREERMIINQVLWDIEGTHGQRKPAFDMYLQGAAGALVIGDSARTTTIEAMYEHARHFQSVQVGRPVVFALNKSDLVEDGKRTKRQRLALESTFDTVAYETSAATGAAVQDLFRCLARRILQIGT